MYELIKVSERCYYIDCPSKIGVVKVSDGEVILIDSGNSKDTGKKIRKILTENGWTLKAIFNTHSHADHIGANNYLQSLTGCRIYARGIEADFTNHPLLESLYVFGGYSPKELRHKFLLADESRVDELSEEVLPEGISLIHLPGHSFDMVGFLVDDGTAYIGDAYSSTQTLDKYGIGFIHDVGAYLDTLSKLNDIGAKVYIPSHAEPTDNVSEIAEYNAKCVRGIIDSILRLCREPVIFEELLQSLFDEYSMTMSFEQYALVGSTVRSYLAYLKDKGEVEVIFENNKMYWKSI